MMKQLMGKHVNVAAKVLPWLWVSGVEVARDREALRRHGITAILNAARDVCSNFFEEVRRPCPPLPLGHTLLSFSLPTNKREMLPSKPKLASGLDNDILGTAAP